MNWHGVIGTLAGLVAMVAAVPYVIDIVKNNVRPNTVSFALWTILLLISLFAQLSAGASWSVLMLVGDTIGTGTILVLCLAGYGYKKYGWLEKICFILAIIAIISWQVTSQPLLAIILAIVADILAAIPTLAKSYRDPWSESPTMWFMMCASATLSLLSTTIYNAENMLFSSYILVINLAVGLTILVGQRIIRKELSNNRR